MQYIYIKTGMELNTKNEVNFLNGIILLSCNNYLQDYNFAQMTPH